MSRLNYHVILYFRDDPFVSELLPEEGPALFDSLSEEDRENIVEE